MYHIKENPRIRESAALIVDGLFRCLKKKSFAELTITEVHQEAGVGRATFYRLFDCMPDVLSYQCDLVFHRLFDDDSWKEQRDYRANFIYFLSYWMAQEELLKAIIESHHLEILYGAHARCASNITQAIARSDEISPVEMEYAMSVLTSVMIGVLTKWYQRGQKETAEELFEIARKATAFPNDMPEQMKEIDKLPNDYSTVLTISP